MSKNIAQRDSYQKEIMEYLKEYNPILTKGENQDNNWRIEIKRDKETILSIQYNLYDYTYDDEFWDDDEIEFEAYWNIQYFGLPNWGTSFSSFDEIKSELDLFFKNKICFLYLIYNNEQLAAIPSEILYTKEMNLRRIPEFLKRKIRQQRRLLKNIQRNTATVKVRYFDPKKDFEYQTNYLKYPQKK